MAHLKFPVTSHRGRRPMNFFASISFRRTLFFFLKMVDILSLNVGFVFYVLLLIKHGFMTCVNHCILVLCSFNPTSNFIGI